MGELLAYLKERYSKAGERSEVQESMHRQRVKNSIISICEKYLKEAGDEFTFEVLGQDLTYAVIVIAEEPLSTRYDFVQVDANIFKARLKSFDIDLGTE